MAQYGCDLRHETCLLEKGSWILRHAGGEEEMALEECGIDVLGVGRKTRWFAWDRLLRRTGEGLGM